MLLVKSRFHIDLVPHVLKKKSRHRIACGTLDCRYEVVKWIGFLTNLNMLTLKGDS